MNPNDLVAQQQAYLNQLLQNAQHLQFVCLVFALAMFIVGAWVLYMFYARLRDIADELRKLRIDYEFVHERKVPSASPPPQSGSMIYD